MVLQHRRGSDSAFRRPPKSWKPLPSPQAGTQRKDLKELRVPLACTWRPVVALSVRSRIGEPSVLPSLTPAPLPPGPAWVMRTKLSGVTEGRVKLITLHTTLSHASLLENY